jgi:type II secretory pathway component PulF
VLALCVALFVFFMLGGGSIHFGTAAFRWMKEVADRILLWLPVLGRMARDGAVQQFSLCAGLMLRSGATLPEAVRAAAREGRRGPLRRRLERVARAVEEGTRLSAAARDAGLGESDLVWFLETGEASGMLADHLTLAATHYETKVRLARRVAARAVVPAFVVLNGLIVAAAFQLMYGPVQDVLRKVIKE